MKGNVILMVLRGQNDKFVFVVYCVFLEFSFFRGWVAVVLEDIFFIVRFLYIFSVIVLDFKDTWVKISFVIKEVDKLGVIIKIVCRQGVQMAFYLQEKKSFIRII